MSGFVSDLLTASLSNHARSLTANTHFNGHPDLVVKGVYPNNQVQAGSEGIEVKSRAREAVPSTRTVLATNGCASLSIR